MKKIKFEFYLWQKASICFVLILLALFSLIYPLLYIINFVTLIIHRASVVEFYFSEIIFFILEIAISFGLCSFIFVNNKKINKLTHKMTLVSLKMVIIIPLILAFTIDGIMGNLNYIDCELMGLSGPKYTKYVYTDNKETCDQLIQKKKTQ